MLCLNHYFDCKVLKFIVHTYWVLAAAAVEPLKGTLKERGLVGSLFIRKKRDKKK